MMSGSESDLELVAACRAGNTEAFGVLVRKHQDRLFPTLLRLAGSVENAQDIMQDAFVRGFQKLDQFHGESSFYTWIYRIAVNLALSDQRKYRHRRSSQQRGQTGKPPQAVELQDESIDSDPALVVERHEREAIIEAALRELSPEHRAVVILKDFDGHRYEEIGVLLDIPVGTVRSRLHRARSELRERLRSLIDPGTSGPQPYLEVERVVDA